MKNDTNWSIDRANSEIAFKIKHLMIATVKGTFPKYDEVIYTKGNDFETVMIDFRIDPVSIDTGDIVRDEQLRKSLFFDVKNYKEIRFTNSHISNSNNGNKHDMWGELSIKGITKTIKLNVVFGEICCDLDGIERAAFVVTGTINRKDWDLDWCSALQVGGEMIGEEVNIYCDIHLINSESNSTFEQSISLKTIK